MNLKECTLLHIGDVHYRDIDRDERPVDMKDKQFPESLDEILPERIYETVLKYFLSEAEKAPLAILLSGDLTTYGEVESLKNCLFFLKSRIPSNFFEKTSFQTLFIVPGNHDIDRKLFCENSLYPKFRPMVKTLEAYNFPEIRLYGVIKEELPINSFGKILIIAINSCLGCGEKRYFPEQIRYRLYELLKYPKGAEEEEEIKKICHENIDTPIFRTDDIEKTVEYIKSAKRVCMPIILTHHNLLPQRRPRIAMYTELINSGYMREELLRLNRPIIYLHGHIHDDPIEIIHSSKYKNARLILISAPLLIPNKIYRGSKCGFNKIKLFYGNCGIPVGCEITLYRMLHGDRDIKTERIPFWTPPASKSLANEDERKTLRYIPKKEINLTDLMKIMKDKGESPEIEEIEKHVDALSWLGLVEYTKRDFLIPMRSVKKVTL